MEKALQSLEAILQCLSVLSIWIIHDGRVESHVIVAMLAVSRGAWPLQLTLSIAAGGEFIERPARAIAQQ
jgi:hypothetical protein